MEKKKYLIVILLLQVSLLCIGQDTIRIDSEISIETKGRHNIAAIVNNFDCLHCPSGKVVDNPFFHLALYTGLEYKLILNEKYSIETGLYLEERSHSGGNNTLSNLVVFPKILLQVKDTIKVGNKNIGLLIKGGDFWNEDIGDILRIYNIDYQGIIGSLQMNKWDISFMTIGDLSKNVGLDLHQTYRFGLGYKNRLFRNLSSLTINGLVTNPGGIHPTSNDINVSNYTKYTMSSDFNIEGQIEVRLNKELSNSIALGLQANYSLDNFNLTSSIRYFSSGFNYGYNGTGPRYTGANGRYVGAQLYPLKNFYRDYSQWAAYTHFGSSDLIALALTSNWDKNLVKKLGFFYDLDINFIYDLKTGKSAIFPIYNTGIKVNFLPTFNGTVSITNKHMELWNFYQTFSISKMPFLSLGFNMKLEEVQLKTMYLKS